jgi:hypothetical protein
MAFISETGYDSVVRRARLIRALSISGMPLPRLLFSRLDVATSINAGYR